MPWLLPPVRPGVPSLKALAALSYYAIRQASFKTRWLLGHGDNAVSRKSGFFRQRRVNR